jgi:hypothetical protein
MIPLDRFTVVLDACTLFPMLVRDVLLTLAGHEFFKPKWSARISAEWSRDSVVTAKVTQRSIIFDASNPVTGYAMTWVSLRRAKPPRSG